MTEWNVTFVLSYNYTNWKDEILWNTESWFSLFILLEYSCFSWILRSRIFFIQSCIYHILQTLKLAWTCAQYTMWDPQDICHKHSLFSWSSPTIWRWWCSDILPTKMCVLVSQIIKIILFVKLILFFLLSFCVPSIYDCYCIM